MAEKDSQDEYYYPIPDWLFIIFIFIFSTYGWIILDFAVMAYFELNPNLIIIAIVLIIQTYFTVMKITNWAEKHHIIQGDI